MPPLSHLLQQMIRCGCCFHRLVRVVFYACLPVDPVSPAALDDPTAAGIAHLPSLDFTSPDPAVDRAIREAVAGDEIWDRRACRHVR